VRLAAPLGPTAPRSFVLRGAFRSNAASGARRRVERGIAARLGHPRSSRAQRGPSGDAGRAGRAAVVELAWLTLGVFLAGAAVAQSGHDTSDPLIEEAETVCPQIRFAAD
jgi:hypothetical protein